MKRFAVILIIAVLALGCVFAATNDTGNGDTGVINPTGGTSGDKFVVKTTIKSIFPVYEIKGTGKDSATATSGDDAEEVEGILSEDGDYLSINVSLYHYGKADNDMSTDAAKANIRYQGNVTVTISAGHLINQTSGVTSSSTDHVYESGDATVGDIAWTKVGTYENFGAEVTSANAATVIAKYENGKKVAGTTANEIAKGSFKWDISGLTAGDTYKADVTVTYTAE